MIAYLIQGLTLGTVGIAPGPFQAYLISQTLKNGWRHTLPAAAAPLLSDGPIIALMVLALTQAPGWLLKALQVIGGLFILKLAYDAFKAFRHMDPDRQPDADAGPASLLNAVVVNFLNPNPWIFWGSVGARELVEGWRLAPLAGLGFMIGFYIMLIGTFVGFVLLFGTARRLGPRITYWLTAVSALALGGFGVYELVVGIGALLSA